MKKKSGPEKKRGWKKRKSDLVPRKSYSPEFIEASLIKIEVDIDEVRNAAPLTAVLRDAEGGLKSVLEAMRFSEDPIILKFLQVYNRGNVHDKACIPWEAWAIKAKLNVTELLGSIMIAMRQRSVNAIKVYSVSTHPEVVRATVRNALKEKGHRDREVIHTALGFLPMRPGATFIDKYFGGTVGNSREEPGDPKPLSPPMPARPDEIDVNDIFPDISETQNLIGDGS